jgi:hypothetical protein
MDLKTRAKSAWNVFMNKDPTDMWQDYGMSYSYRPDRPKFTGGNARTMAAPIYNRIAMDAAGMNIRHVLLDKNGRYKEDVSSGLNNCLKLEANIDQSARAFIQDVVMSLLDEGCVAIVPIDTDRDRRTGEVKEIYTMRTGKIVQWYPENIKVSVYNDRTGQREEVIVSKRRAAVIENPLYAVINEKNSTMQRLIRKLSLLDAVDEENSAGKFNMIIQLPYAVKTETRRNQAERRRKDMEEQLKQSKYGIAYVDATEKITQLNRPLENSLNAQVEYLTNKLYGELGMTLSILDGTADEKTMLNYYSRTIEPIVSEIAIGMKRVFLTDAQRENNESIEVYQDPFKLVPVNNIAEIADKFTRNEIMTSNEIRQVIGMKPSDDPKADELRNSNISASKEEMRYMYDDGGDEEGENQNGW